MSDPVVNAQSEFASIIRTAITEGGEGLQMLLKVAMGSPLIAFVLGVIMTEIAEKRLGWISSDAGALIKGGLVAFVGVDVIEGIASVIPFKAGTYNNPLGPTTLVLTEAPKIPDAPARRPSTTGTVSFEDLMESVRNGRLSTEDATAQLAGLINSQRSVGVVK